MTFATPPPLNPGGFAPPTPNPAAMTAERVKSASTDALGAFKIFALNPVGGLAQASASLGESKCLGVGLVFGGLFSLCMLFATYRMVSGFGGFGGVSGFFQVLVVSLVPFASLFGTCAVARKVFGGQGGLATDSFISGAALLPFGFVTLAASILGFGNMEVITILSFMAFCLTILMLFAALTRIDKITERLATLGVPLILMATVWLSKIIYTAMIQHSMGMPMGGGMPPGF